MSCDKSGEVLQQHSKILFLMCTHFKAISNGWWACKTEISQRCRNLTRSTGNIHTASQIWTESNISGQ